MSPASANGLAGDGEPAPAVETGWRRLLFEPARPGSIASRRDAHWLVVGTVCVGAFMGQLDASIVTLAFPTLKQDFHATIGAVQWVGLTYLLVLVSVVVAVGRFADMVGRKLLYTYGFVVFIIGSALCGLAPSLLALDMFRALQAVGAAMMQANSLAIITHAMPSDKLGRGIGVQGAAQALGLSLGPVVGGLLIALGGWRLIFFVNVPVGILGTIAAWFLIPRSRHLQSRLRFDWLGLGLFVPGLSALLLVVSFGSELGWGSPATGALLGAAVGLGVAFLARERTARAPMLDLTLFSRPAFTAGVASGLLSYIVLFGVLFVVPFFLEGDRGFSPRTAGAVLAVLPVALALVAPFAGRTADRIGPRPLTVAGMLISAAGLVLLAIYHSSVPVLLAELALLGAGLGAFTPPNNAAIMGSAPRAESGMASGVLNLTRGVGTSLGLALTALVFGLVASTHATPALVGEGFAVSMGFLAALALIAAVFAALRGAAAPSGPAAADG